MSFRTWLNNFLTPDPTPERERPDPDKCEVCGQPAEFHIDDQRDEKNPRVRHLCERHAAELLKEDE